jgi:hypothetical protein
MRYTLYNRHYTKTILELFPNITVGEFSKLLKKRGHR